ncbi:hypothetical protein OG528_38455 [Streptomyces platensis]|uniref:hypothetical protein n=1 Tax=Streptomyces platensis TaxID=58346 RepID=UPI0030E59FEB
MDQVNSGVAVVERTGPLTSTGHALQCTGAWAVAVMAGRERPDQATADDLEAIAEIIGADAARAAVSAKTDARYDWWKVLFALYPNSKVTHAGRRRDVAVLKYEMAAMFAPDAAGGSGDAVHPRVVISPGGLATGGRPPPAARRSGRSSSALEGSQHRPAPTG